MSLDPITLASTQFGLTVSAASEIFFVVGGLAVIPVVLACTALSYRLFRARAVVPAPDS